MLDSIGLGEFLVDLGALCGIVLFSGTFLICKMILKMNIIWSSLIAICLGVLGFFASPYLFIAFY